MIRRRDCFPLALQCQWKCNLNRVNLIKVSPHSRSSVEQARVRSFEDPLTMIHRLHSLFFLCGLTASFALVPSYDLFATMANATMKQLSGSLVEFPSNGVAGAFGWKLTDFQSWTSGFFPGTLFQLANREEEGNSQERVKEQGGSCVTNLA